MEAIHGVEIYGFEVNGYQIMVDVYGGIESPISGCLYYELMDDKRVRAHVKLLRTWMITEEPLTYVVNPDEDGYGTLMETATFLMRFKDVA